MIIKCLQFNNKKFKKSFLEAGLLFSGYGIKCKQTQIIFKMKKLLVVLAIGAFAACGSNSGDSTTSDSSSTSTMDTTTVAPAMPDTSMMSGDSTMKMGDTSTATKRDSTKM